MTFYHLTIKHGFGITHAVHGDFSGENDREIAVSTGKTLKLLKVLPDLKKVHILLTMEVLGEICSMAVFRGEGMKKDYLIVTSATGMLFILEYDGEENVFKQVIEHTLSSNKSQRSMLGVHLAIDQRRYTIMIGAMEEEKCVFKLSPKDQSLDISSSLQISEEKTCMFHMVGIDGNGDGPCFACLKAVYKDFYPGDRMVRRYEQLLCFYELDMELNKIKHQYSKRLVRRSNMLISVPDDKALLIFYENYVSYHSMGSPEILCPIPKAINELSDSPKPTIFVCCTQYRIKNEVFFLAQTEKGHIFKISLHKQNNTVTEIKLKYIDSIPTATALCVLDGNFLFVAAEFGNHLLYKILESSSDRKCTFSSSNAEKIAPAPFYFLPTTLKNLNKVTELQSLSPIMHLEVSNLANPKPTQLHVACGRGPRSSLRTLKHELELRTLKHWRANFEENPVAVWAVEAKKSDDFVAYVVVSFENSTRIFGCRSVKKVMEGVDDLTIQEVFESNFIYSKRTLNCGSTASGGIIQVIPLGIILLDAEVRPTWMSHEEIVNCTLNETFVVAALSDNKLVSFAINSSKNDLEKPSSTRVANLVTCMVLWSSTFVVVGLQDETILIMTTDLEKEILIDFKVLPMSMAFVNAEDHQQPQLMVGTKKGALLLVFQNDKFEGGNIESLNLPIEEEIKLLNVVAHDNNGVLFIGNNLSLYYCCEGAYYFSPLYLDVQNNSLLKRCINFCPPVILNMNQSIVLISKTSIMILKIEEMNAGVGQSAIPLKYTPRKIALHPQSGNLFTIETDHNCYTTETKTIKKGILIQDIKSDQNLSSRITNAPDSVDGDAGNWASVIRIMDVAEKEPITNVHLKQDEAAFSLCYVDLTSSGKGEYIFVGIAKDMKIGGNQGLALIDCYAVSRDGNKFTSTYGIQVKDTPSAICQFQNGILAGIGKKLTRFDIMTGKWTLKWELECVPNRIVSIVTLGDWIVAGDSMGGFVYIWKGEIMDQDPTDSWITAACLMGCNRVAKADKYGNLFIVKLPEHPKVVGEVRHNEIDMQDEFSPSQHTTATKIKVVASFHVGEMVMSLKCVHDRLLYGTLSGSIGILTPLPSPDVVFLEKFEKLMQMENLPLCGKEHKKFRSFYSPVQKVIDGDFCEQFKFLDKEKQLRMAALLGTFLEEPLSPNKVSSRLKKARKTYSFQFVPMCVKPFSETSKKDREL